MKNHLTPLLAALLLLCTATHAVDTSPPASPNSGDKLAAARELIADKRWPAAIDELKRVNATDSADWNNLMGYTHRKAPTPDLAGAERYYDAALRLQPQHRGALEYSGELFLMLGDLPRAEQRLTALDKACLLPCTEFSDLKAAVARYKANGNRYAPAGRY